MEFADALMSWSEFVDECAEGYSFGVYEYDNDLQVRDLLELAFDGEADELLGAEEARRSIVVVDERFRRILKPGVRVPGASETWWSGAVPARGGVELVEDLEENYRTEIDLVEGR
ncbi:hypothetical protein [Myceligenerans indicum]|uniref:CdiI immunity protein domain-containing protein n=1 Tax=Myceligenerans indicum TaxID=2593663 RepID=A0ABS1LID3_9MICO|nr:hypothetical protein [Myceligenerans indicum]MBL0885908.1 hypothetical protein [Myceligenerans indicum]